MVEFRFDFQNAFLQDISNQKLSTIKEMDGARQKTL